MISQIANDRETMDQETRYTLVEDHEDDVKEWFEPSSYEKDYYGRKLFPTWNWPGEDLNQKCSKQDDCRFKDDDGRVFRYDCITPCKDSWGTAASLRTRRLGATLSCLGRGGDAPYA